MFTHKATHGAWKKIFHWDALIYTVLYTNTKQTVSKHTRSPDFSTLLDARKVFFYSGCTQAMALHDQSVWMVRIP
jgi:hypothetical protein